MTFAVYTKQFPDELIGAVRTAMIVTAIIGIVPSAASRLSREHGVPSRPIMIARLGE